MHSIHALQKDTFLIVMSFPRQNISFIVFKIRNKEQVEKYIPYKGIMKMNDEGNKNTK